MSSLDDKNLIAASPQEDSSTDTSTKEEETFAQHTSLFNSSVDTVSQLQLPQDTPVVVASFDSVLSSKINQSQASNVGSAYAPRGFASTDFTSTGATIFSTVSSDQAHDTNYGVTPPDPSKIPEVVNGKDDEIRSALSWDDKYGPTGIYGLGIDPETKHDPLLDNYTRGLIDQQSSKYKLRQSIDRENFRGSGWGDKDESGTYNPNEKVARAKSKTKRIRLVNVSDSLITEDQDEDGSGNRDEDEDEESPHKKQRKATMCERDISKVGSQWVTLKFETPEGQERYEAMATSFSDDETGQDVYDNVVRHFSDDELPDEENDPIAFSSPVEPGNRYDRATQRNHMPDLTAENVGDFNQEELAMHPSARACIECLQLRVRCSIWDDEDFKFPCDSCKEHGMDCHLIDKTIWKKKCERCCNKNQGCSYELNGGEDGMPCDSCKAAEIDCLAGPANREQEIPTKKMPIFSDSKSDTEEVPVEREQSIKKVEVPWQFQKKPKSKLAPRGNGPTGYDFTPEEECNSENSMDETTGAPAGSKYISLTTEFCHPITFNSPPTIGQPCHFCEAPGIKYCLRGIEKQTVRVIVWDDPALGYEEVGTRHLAPGFETTRMCVRCTSSRLRTISCQLHVIKQIDGRDDRTYDTKTAFERIREKDRPNHEQEQLWCSICCYVAFFECCTLPEFDCVGDGAEGCGLLLCPVCATLMTEDHSYRKDQVPAMDLLWSGCRVEVQMGLDQMILIAEMDGLRYPGCMRADATFLKMDGELNRRLTLRDDEDGNDELNRRLTLRGDEDGNDELNRRLTLRDDEDGNDELNRRLTLRDDEDGNDELNRRLTLRDDEDGNDELNRRLTLRGDEDGNDELNRRLTLRGDEDGNGELNRRLTLRDDEDGNGRQKANDIIEISSDEEMPNDKAAKNWKKMLQETDFS